MSIKLNTYQTQEITKGVYLEKILEVESAGYVYQINVDCKLFACLELKIDILGSKNITLLNEKTNILKCTIYPFSKTTIARFSFSGNLDLKFNYEFSLKTPSIPLQTEALSPFVSEINRELESSVNLRTINLSEFQNTELASFFKNLQKRFIDFEFPPKNESIGMSENQIIETFGCLIHWRKLRTLLEKSESDFFSENLPEFGQLNPDPCDVRQGLLNNSQVVSAISTIAEHPSLILRLINLNELLSYGFVRVRLYARGEWKNFLMDDYFPCYPLGDPLFSKNKSAKIWFLVLEKALAKVYGNYRQLVNRNIKDSLIDLTGCPTFSYKMTDQVILDQLQNDRFWNTLKEWLLLQFLVTVTPKQTLVSMQVPLFRKNNSLQVHRIISVDGFKIISIRNPWSKPKWTGEWAQGSPQWTSDILKTVQPDFELNKDHCWISWQNFLLNFEEINVCKVSGWNELNMRGKFVTLVNGVDDTIKRFSSNTYFKLTVKKKTSIILGIHQNEECLSGNSFINPYIDIGLALLKEENGVYQMLKYLDSDFVRQNYAEVFLEAGEYKLVPMSVGLILQQQIKKQNKIILTNENLSFIVADIFDKFVMQGKSMSLEQLKLILPLINSELPADYLEIIAKDFSIKNYQWLFLPEFEKIFRFLIKNKNEQEKETVLLNFGYTANLLSYRSRRFNISIHSSIAIQVRSMDAILDNMDFVVYATLIQKFGKIVEDFNEISVRESAPIAAKYYYNQFFKKKD